MQNHNRNLNNLKNYNKLGNSRKYKKPKSELRIFIEAILMWFIGTNLILFLYAIPKKLPLKEFLQEAWTNLSQGFIQLFEALVKIGAVITVVFLLLFSLFLLIGGIIRLTKLINYSRKPNSRNSIGKVFKK